jgi:tRNA-2-methylthio-N6-dimethylallyladenosine synthase
VPYTRGREVSRPAHDILAEIQTLADNNIKEVTLLGQNVNSYGKTNGHADEGTDFPALLRSVSTIVGIERIRFTTSHPKDLSEDLMRTFQEIDKLCPHFHLPVQSGSNRILKRMNRKYTIESYTDKVNTLRSFQPDIALTTDIIVGFPGETEEDFAATMDLLHTIRFHSSFSFKYSDRPNAKSISFDNKVEEAEKSKRLQRLQAAQDAITLERNQEYIGRQLRVMVEGQSKAAAGQLSGRSETNHIVNFDGDRLQPGETVEVMITEGLLHSLRGMLVQPG